MIIIEKANKRITGNKRYAEWLTEDGLLRIKGWARDGLTEKQIAHNIGINVKTLWDWKTKYGPICNALKEGKAPVDIEVENALLKRALGYQYEETVTEVEELPTGKIDDHGKPIMKQVKHIRKILKFALPDTTAQIFWLKNRRPDKWRDKPAEIEDTGTMEKLDQMLSEVWSYAANAKTS